MLKEFVLAGLIWACSGSTLSRSCIEETFLLEGGPLCPQLPFRFPLVGVVTNSQVESALFYFVVVLGWTPNAAWANEPPERYGDIPSDSMATNYATIGVMTGLLLPAVQAAREAARRMSSSNNLKQIVLSLWNYESAYKKIPGRMVKSKDGKPLLSWRVMILPYLEENQLYNEFHMDEPWDSKHNIQLLERMPAVFANPRVAAAPGYTVYFAPSRFGYQRRSV